MHGKIRGNIQIFKKCSSESELSSFINWFVLLFLKSLKYYQYYLTIIDTLAIKAAYPLAESVLIIILFLLSQTLLKR